MKHHTRLLTALATSASLVAIPVYADLGDVLIGGAIGAVVTDQIHRNKDKKEAGQTAPRTNSTASLNSQYSTAERVEIQQALADQGYNIGTIDGVLGPKSRAAISGFQASIGEPATGQLTATQFVALTNPGAASPSQVAARPLQQNEVFMLQQGLQQLGYYNGVVNGVPGPGTNGALTAFLVNQRVDPQAVTPVQSLVMVSNTAGMAVPPYLVQEASYGAVQTQPAQTQPVQTQPATTGGTMALTPTQQQPTEVSTSPASTAPTLVEQTPTTTEPTGQSSDVFVVTQPAATN